MGRWKNFGETISGILILSLVWIGFTGIGLIFKSKLESRSPMQSLLFVNESFLQFPAVEATGCSANNIIASKYYIAKQSGECNALFCKYAKPRYTTSYNKADQNQS